MRTAANFDGILINSVLISFQTAVEQHQRPAVKYPLSNVMTRMGQKVKLECAIAGNPRPEINWMHNGKPLSDRDVNVSR